VCGNDEILIGVYGLWSVDLITEYVGIFLDCSYHYWLVFLDQVLFPEKKRIGIRRYQGIATNPLFSRYPPYLRSRSMSRGVDETIFRNCGCRHITVQRIESPIRGGKILGCMILDPGNWFTLWFLQGVAQNCGGSNWGLIREILARCLVTNWNDHIFHGIRGKVGWIYILVREGNTWGTYFFRAYGVTGYRAYTPNKFNQGGGSLSPLFAHHGLLLSKRAPP